MSTSSDFQNIPLGEEIAIRLDFEARSFLASRTQKNLPALNPGQSRFGFLINGGASLSHAEGSRLTLSPGMYFSINSAWTLELKGTLLSIAVPDRVGLTQVGGPVEPEGRLQYIDGCTDSLLIPPSKWGDPCLNLLVFPPHIKQSAHTHPSFRVGVVIDGSGECRMRADHVALKVGDFFSIPAGTEHSFHSGANGLRVIAFHPDSDFGPTDEVHPMINRTHLAKRS